MPKARHVFVAILIVLLHTHCTLHVLTRTAKSHFEIKLLQTSLDLFHEDILAEADGLITGITCINYCTGIEAS